MSVSNWKRGMRRSKEKKMRGDIMKGLLYSVLECELVENNLEILGRGVT